MIKICLVPDRSQTGQHNLKVALGADGVPSCCRKTSLATRLAHSLLNESCADLSRYKSNGVLKVVAARP